MVVVIIVAVIFIATLLSGLLKDSGDHGDWTMPNFVGMDFNDAVAKYGNNIQFEEESEEYNEADAGIIISQDIEPGTEFKKGDTVKVKVSKGMETVLVPDCSNMNQEIAKDLLRQRGLECEVKNSTSSEVKKGYVIKTEPEKDAEVHKGSTIILYVSMGIDAGTIKVENFVGMKAEDAVTYAEYKGLKPKTEPVASYKPEGEVVEQSIAKDEKVDAGTEIVFKVSNGKNPDGEINFQVPFPADASGRFIIDFTLSKEDGTKDVQSTTTLLLPEMGSITQSVKGSGENVNVIVTLTNLNSGARATIGNYVFNFADKTTTTQSEDIYGAFQQVGGFPAPTEPETEAPPTTTTMPYLIGSDFNSVAGAYSVNIINSGSEYSQYPAGTILSQSISGGTEVNIGETVYVTVSAGPEPQVEPQPPVTPDPPVEGGGEGEGQ